jgi:hypothetical protein
MESKTPPLGGVSVSGQRIRLCLRRHCLTGMAGNGKFLPNG